MTPEKTVLYWSYYVLVIGLLLLLAPGFTFDLLGMDLEGEIWVRVVGVVVLLLATYYYAAAISNARMVVVASLLGRVFAALALVVLWLTGGPWQLSLFALLDLSGAVWTWSALQSE